MRQDIRIVLLGDSNVGKSTLITSLIKEVFVPSVQHVVPEVTIPPEITLENVTTHIIDTSNRPEYRDVLEAEIRKAHSICIVYSISDPSTLERVKSYWLPLLRKLGVNVPIVLTGNKLDLRQNVETVPLSRTPSTETADIPVANNTSSNSNNSNNSNSGSINGINVSSNSNNVISIMHEFREIDSSVECSAKIPRNVPEVFYFAQKAVLYPTSPLYDSRSQSLKADCITALTRIFKLCDYDNDGILNSNELNLFEKKCFDTPLQLSEIDAILDIVQQHEPDGVKSIKSASGEERGLTLKGFLYLHTLYVQRGRVETAWMVLKRFHYSHDLKLNEEFVNQKVDVPIDCTAELSPQAYQFLIELLQAHDKDEDGALSDIELANLFEITPGNPWLNKGWKSLFSTTTTNSRTGALTLQGFLAMWSMMTLLDPQLTLSYLAYLGYESIDSDITRAISITKCRKREKISSPPSLSSSISSSMKPRSSRNKGQRNVLFSYVIGAPSCGKSSLLSAHLDKANAANTIKSIDGSTVTPLDAPLSRQGTPPLTPTLIQAAISSNITSSNNTAELLQPFPPRPTITVNSIDFKGSDKYLIMRKCSTADIQQLFPASSFANTTVESASVNEKHSTDATDLNLELCDVVCLVYDASNPSSFRYIAHFLEDAVIKTALEHIPILVVATRRDLEPVEQDFPVVPDEFCRIHGLQPPLSISVRDMHLADVFHRLVSLSLDPSSSVLRNGRRSDGSKPGSFHSGSLIRRETLLVSAVVVSVSAVLVYYFGTWTSAHPQHSSWWRWLSSSSPVRMFDRVRWPWSKVSPASHHGTAAAAAPSDTPSPF
ncbi:hypothetical protein GQ42DRAFT_160046 [Ramicandelaber brevisporus]|nr:hypothetical protein GQ42DRAFT_160046 [Ramicandelaber brevisporus]